MAQQTKNQIKSYFEAGDRPNDVEFGHLFDSILFLNELNQGSNTDVTSLAGGLTLGGTLTLTGTTDFKMGGNILIGNLNENLTRPIQAYSSTNETIIFASGSISNVQYEGISGDATASIKLKDNYASTATAVFGTHTGKAFIAVGDNEVFNVSASNAGYNSFFSGSIGIGTASPSEELHVVGSGLFDGLDDSNVGSALSATSTLINGYGITGNRHAFYITNLNDTGGIFFGVGGTHSQETKMTINANGRVGIGTTAPSTKLHVEGTTANEFIRVQTTTGNANLQGVTDLSNFSWLARGSSNRFDLIDQNAPTTIMKIFGDSSVSETLVLREGKVGIGTDTPAQKLEVEGGHIQLSNGYGLGRGFGTDSLYVFYPFLADADVPNTFVNITPSNSNTGGMSLQADRTISFVETDSNILVGQMELNQKKFDWDGNINADKVFANELHGDGSNITNIVGSQISGFVNNAGDNRIITVVDSSGNAIRGESDFTFDGTDVKLDGNLAIGKGSAGLFTPDAPLHIRHEGPNLGDLDLIHLSANDNGGVSESNISIKFSDAAAVATQHFKITYGEGDNDLKFHSDSVSNILSLEDDGKVGIGVASGMSAKLTVDGSIKSLEGSIGNLNVGDGKGQQMEFGTDAVTTLRFDADRWRVYTGGGSFEAFTVLENGNIGIGNSAPSQKLHLVSTSDIKIHVKSSKVDGASTIIAENDAHKFEYGLASDDTFRIINRGPTSSPSSTVPVKISPSSIDNLLFVDDSSVVIAGNTPSSVGGVTSKLTVEGRFTSKAGLDEDYIRFAGPNVTLSAQHPDSPGGSVGVTAGIRRLTGQGGIGMFSDSCLVLHAGDNTDTLADAVAAFHNRGDGSPGDNNSESIHLIADGTIQLRTNAQSGLTHANIHHYTFNNGGLIVNGISEFNFTRYKLQVEGGGIAIDSSGNGDRGMIFQGGEGKGIGLLGNDSRNTNTRMDLHVEDDGRVTIGNVAPHGNSPLTIKSIQTNSDVFNIVSAGTNATRIIQFSDTTNGHGLLDMFQNDGTHGARIYPAGHSFFTNRLGIGVTSPTNPLHVKSSSDAPLLVESTDSFSGISLKDSDTTTGFIGIAADADEFIIRTDNTNRLRISDTGRAGMGAAPSDDNRLRIAGISGATIAGSTATDLSEATLLIGSKSSGLGMDNNELYFAGNDGNFGTITTNSLNILINSATKAVIGSSNFTIKNSLKIDGTGRNFYIDDYDDGAQNSRVISRDNAFSIFEGGFVVGNYSNGTFVDDSALTEKQMHTKQIRIGDPANNNYRRIFMSSGRMFFQQMSGTSWDANAPYIENGDTEGQIETFTGQHRNKPSSNISNYTDKKGYIVVSSGIYSNIPENRTKEEIDSNNTEVLTTPQIDEALPIVDLSTTANDKKVFGVIANVDDPGSNERHVVVQGGLNRFYPARVDDRLVINSLGEGAIMISNYNGNLENGDYITTSPIPGIGMKQDDDLLHNYTVAKITQDCTFDGNEEIAYEGVNYKIQLVGCTYHCG